MPQAFLDSSRRRELARLLTQAARGQRVTVPTAAKPARIVAVTGAAGVGKSTLVGKLIEHVRSQNQTVAVLACDPQSPLSGGALLGDRFRMPARADDDGVFIRSLAASSGHGPLAEHLATLAHILEAFGFDIVIIETAGAGQGDTAVRHLADVVLLLLQPETGDDLQWEKAGLLEVADVIAIHKADLPGADQAFAQVIGSIELAERPIPVLRISSRTGEGIAELWRTLVNCPRRRRDGSGKVASWLKLVHEELAARLQQLEGDPQLNELAKQQQRGEIDEAQLVDAVVRRLIDENK